MPPPPKKISPDEYICTKSLADMYLERIIRLHYRDEDFIRWGTERRYDMNCFYNGFPPEAVENIFRNKRFYADTSRTSTFAFINSSQTVEDLKENIDTWQQGYRKGNLEGIREMEKYKYFSEEEVIDKLINDLPGEDKAVHDFIHHEKELFQKHVKYIKKEQPDSVIPLSSRYIQYIDDELKPHVTICNKICKICEPSHLKQTKKKHK